MGLNQLHNVVGIDVGPALSLVVGGNKPYYEVVGFPRLRSIELMKAASRNSHQLIVSEEVYLALRPRHFDFDDRNPIQVMPGLVGYSLRKINPNSVQSTSQQSPRYLQDFEPHKDVGSSAESTEDEEAEPGSNARLIDETTQSTTLPTMDTSPLPSRSKPAELHSLSFFAQQNQRFGGNRMSSPKHSMFNSMNSSISSELYSIDLSVETDSEMEWITPEMLVYNRVQKHRNQNNNSATGARSLNQRPTYKGDHAKQYSDFSEVENVKGSNISSRLRRKRWVLFKVCNGVVKFQLSSTVVKKRPKDTWMAE